MLRTARLIEGFQLAASIHHDHIRKGSGVPYLTHLMMVSATVGEYGGDEDLMIAALLHDTLEDHPTRITKQQIANQFGWRVARVVDGCSDCTIHPKPPWEERKKAFLARLRTEDADVRLVASADKLHNASTLVRDVTYRGDGIWSIFNAGKDRQCWYLRSCVEALEDGWRHPILDTLKDVVQQLHTRCSLDWR